MGPCQGFEDMVVLAVDDRMTRLVAATRDSSCGLEAGVDGVTKLRDDDQIVQWRCGLFSGRVKALQLGLLLLAALDDLCHQPYL